MSLLLRECKPCAFCCDENFRNQVHLGNTQVWSRGGHVAPAQELDPSAVAWRSDVTLPPECQSVQMLGTLPRHYKFVRAPLRANPLVNASMRIRS